MLGACDSTFKWKEEIRLHDGRIVIAERVDVLGGWHEPGQSASEKERAITFTDPDDKSIKYTHSRLGSGNYILLDFKDGVPWLIVLVGAYSTDTKCPYETYETFTWVDKGWRSVSYASLPKGVSKVNMAYDYAPDQPDMRKAGKLLTADQIDYINMKSSKLGGAKSAYQLVQVNGRGMPIDCDYYRKISEGGG